MYYLFNIGITHFAGRLSLFILGYAYNSNYHNNKMNHKIHGTYHYENHIVISHKHHLLSNESESDANRLPVAVLYVTSL